MEENCFFWILHIEEITSYKQWTKSEANGHVGLGDIKEEGAWMWDNGCPLDGNTTVNMTFDNEDARYDYPAANCVAAVYQTGTLIFEDFCCDSIKHWYCAIHF